ncbi:MAG: hypothetical protein APR53_03560 [Methanoculleus sp. SDB]|nr:MAG: hypothetical protein APR53_03560 [Methanoculleus sp. SDB]
MLIGEDGQCEVCPRSELRGNMLFCTKYLDLCERVRITCEDDATLAYEDDTGTDFDEDREDW